MSHMAQVMCDAFNTQFKSLTQSMSNIYTNDSQIYTLTEIREGVIRSEYVVKQKRCAHFPKETYFNLTSVCISLFPCLSKDPKVWKGETEREVKRSKNKRHTQYTTTPITVKL